MATLKIFDDAFYPKLEFFGPNVNLGTGSGSCRSRSQTGSGGSGSHGSRSLLGGSGSQTSSSGSRFQAAMLPYPKVHVGFLASYGVIFAAAKLTFHLGEAEVRNSHSF